METKFVKNCTYTKFRKIQWKQNLEKRSKSIQKFVLIKLKKYLNFIKNPSKKDIIKKMSKKLYHNYIHTSDSYSEVPLVALTATKKYIIIVLFF